MTTVACFRGAKRVGEEDVEGKEMKAEIADEVGQEESSLKDS